MQEFDAGELLFLVENGKRGIQLELAEIKSGVAGGFDRDIILSHV